MRPAAVGNPHRRLLTYYGIARLLPPPPCEIEHLAEQPAARSVSHLIQEGADARVVRVWKLSLTRAVRIMGTHDLPQDDVHAHAHEQRDSKGHALASSEDGSYSFCSRCFVLRRSRDRKNGSRHDPVRFLTEVPEAYMKNSCRMDTVTQSSPRDEMEGHSVEAITTLR